MLKDLVRLRYNKRLIQFTEFLFGGAIYFWTGIIVFAVLYELLNLHWFVSKVVADFSGMTLSYLVQRYWAFYDKRLEDHDRTVILRYYFVNIMDFFFDYGIVGLAVYMGITPYIGFVVSAMFTTAWDYFWYRFWVFNPNTNTPH